MPSSPILCPLLKVNTVAHKPCSHCSRTTRMLSGRCDGSSIDTGRSTRARPRCVAAKGQSSVRTVPLVIDSSLEAGIGRDGGEPELAWTSLTPRSRDEQFPPFSLNRSIFRRNASTDGQHQELTIIANFYATYSTVCLRKGSSTSTFGPGFDEFDSLLRISVDHFSVRIRGVST